MSVTIQTESASGQSFTTDQRVIVVHDGARGAVGPEGAEGPQGEQGDSINVRGAWSSGTTYCPLDAVTGRSSAASGIQSLFLQRSTEACSVSTTEPYLDPSRWDEVGAADLSNITGAIWEIQQINHQFEYIGTPVAFSHQTKKWVKADASMADELAVAIVREVIDSNRAILQTSGEVPWIEDDVIWPDGSSWQLGRFYYVSANRGRLELEPPTDPDAYNQPLLIATNRHVSTLPDPISGSRVGVVLPWSPLGARAAPASVLVGKRKYLYLSTAGQSVFTGVDLFGETLSVAQSPNTDVFVDGIAFPDQDGYLISPDGLTVTIQGALPGNNYVEIWTPDQPLELVVPSTQVKLDNIAAGFDGGETIFSLAVSATAIQTDSLNLLVFLDAAAQEPLVDYTIVDDPGNPGYSALSFNAAPEEGTRFWGTVFIPVPS